MVTIETPTARDLDVVQDLQGPYVASLTRKGPSVNAHVDPEQVQRMLDDLGIHHDVSVRPFINHVSDLRGQMKPWLGDTAVVILNLEGAEGYDGSDESPTEVLWHELTHVLDYQVSMDLSGRTQAEEDARRMTVLMAERGDLHRINPQREYETRPDEVYAVNNARRLTVGHPEIQAASEIKARELAHPTLDDVFQMFR